MNPSGRFRRTGRLACALLLAPLGGCFSATTAEDPLPGPVQRSVLRAAGDTLEVQASALVPGAPEESLPWLIEPDWVALWIRVPAGTSVHPAEDGSVVWQVGADRAPRFTLEPEPGGGTRIRVEEGPFPADEAGHARGERVRVGWVEALKTLRLSRDRPLATAPAPFPDPGA